MSKPLKMTCLDCGSVNRVPSDKLSAGPKCGTCGGRLADQKVKDIDAATLAKAQKADDLPLVVDYWAPWCGPCRQMAPDFIRAANALGTGARFAKINTEDYPKASQKANIRGIPTMVIYQGGREVARQSGAIPASAIESFVRSKSKVGG